MSSRNAYLSPDERERATALFKALQAGSSLAAAGDFDGASNEMLKVLRSVPGVEPDYATAVDADSFGPPEPGSRILLVVAARVGPARLIDNLLVEVENA